MISFLIFPIVTVLTVVSTVLVGAAVVRAGQLDEQDA